MLADLIEPEAFRFRIQLERGNFGSFYGATEENAEILKERREWLARDPGRYLCALPAAEPLLRETIGLARSHNTIPSDIPIDAQDTVGLGQFLGENWEADYLLLKHDATGAPRLVGGCVCFPSSWALEGKIGASLDQIHGVVPGLNVEIGKHISTFLARIKPGFSWNRHNWGLSASPERNQHPARSLKKLDSMAVPDETFFRVEKQSLVALPDTGGILFGIRISVYPLNQVKAKEAARVRLIHALETMPSEVAHYKGLGLARNRIIDLLRA